MEVFARGTFFSIKDIKNGYLFCQNGIQKGKGLGLWREPSHIELCRVPDPLQFGLLAVCHIILLKTLMKPLQIPLIFRMTRTSMVRVMNSGKYLSIIWLVDNAFFSIIEDKSKACFMNND